ncbi:MAG TPA: hypothetical protein VN842_00550, partial [Thermoplasmata archaeon]|nr:hypothetical protein [Thermoplasmata archaeon]
NGTLSPLEALDRSTSNGTVIEANPDGVVTVTLPVGNYSVYALGYVGGSLESALTSVAAFPGLPSTLTPLRLGTTVRLSGAVAAVGPSTNSTQAAVLVYGGGFDEVSTWAASDGNYSLLLPVGNYTVLALEGSSATTTGISAALTSVVLQYPTVLPLQPVGAVATRFSVGSPLPNGALFPAVAASVSISAGPSGPSVPGLASSDGSVAFYLPSSVPLSSGGYCITAQSAGFVPSSVCGYTGNELASLSRVPMSLRLVSVVLSVTGLPAGTPVSVNFTALGAPATTHTFSGGPVFTFTTTPGPYTVSARAVIGKGTVIYLPSSLLNTTIPLGAYSSNLALRVVPGVNSTGTLELPSGGAAANVSVTLSSPIFNVTVNGTNFTHGFYAAPATYSAHATETLAGVTYTNVTRVTVSASGTITPAVSLRVAGVSVTGKLITSAGNLVPLNTTITLTAPDGASLPALVENGSFTTSLPAHSAFLASAEGVVVTTGPNGSYFVTYATPSGVTCRTTSNATTCPIEVVPGINLVWLNGTLVAAGVPGLQPGIVRLVGPYPATTVTVLTSTNGSFSAELLPGAYSVYATGGGASELLADLTTAVALPTSAPIVLHLGPTWNANITVTGPNGSAATFGPATVVVRNVFGAQAVYTGVAARPWAPLLLSLPLGTYTVSAFATGAPYGVSANASGTAHMTISAGNVALALPLAYTYSYRATGTLIGSPGQTLNAGGKVTYQFSVRNAGDAPITVHPVGSPSYWTFNFSFANATLSPGNSLTAEVTIHVPAGTVVLHPPVLIELELGNGTVVGSVAPSPDLNIIGYYGVGIGMPPSAAPTVSTAKALLPFYLIDTGNVFEDVHLTIVDQARLASLGWNVNIRALNHTLGGPVGLSPGVNSTAEVNLTAVGPVFVPVGTVTLSAIVINSSGAVAASVTLNVPVATVSPGSPNVGAPFTVTGPGVASPPATLPDWVIPLLVFVPAIGLTVVLFVRRWLKTRRWTRR